MTAPAVVLRYEAGDDEGASAIAVVEVIDENLRTCGHVTVDAGRTVVPLPRPGPYLVRGWTPAGRPMEAMCHTENQAVVTIAPTPSDGLAREPRQAARWAVLWTRTGSRWTPMTRVQALTEASRTGLPRRPAGTPVAVQVGDDEGPTSTVLTMQDEDLLVSTLTAADGQVAVAGDDVAAALLGYLHQGDLRSATVLADRLDRSPMRRTALADLSLAYARFLTAPDPAVLPADELVRQLPGSSDVHILSAWQKMQLGQPDVRAARSALIDAHRLGGPVIAAGVRLLADGLALLAQDHNGLPHRPTADALAQVRRYQRVLRPAALTTYFALTPNVPLHLDLGLPAASPAERRAWMRVSAHTAQSGGMPYFGDAEDVQPPLARSAVRAMQTAERRALESIRDAGRPAEQIKERRRIFGVLQSIGFGPDHYGLASDSVAISAGAVSDLTRERERLWRTDAGTIVTRWSAGELQVQGSAEGLVRLRCGINGGHVDWLMPLIAADSAWGELEGRLRMPYPSVRQEIISVRLAGLYSLTRSDTPLISRSVEHADKTARLAWRALSRLYPPGEPVTEAILDSLV